MPAAHRFTDSRICGAGTIVTGQSTVFVNGLLWAVQGDPNDHGAGNLVASGAPNVFIEGKPVIVVGDPANEDNLCPPLGPPHCSPDAAAGSGNVTAADDV